MFIDYLAFDLHGSCPQPPLRRRCNCGALPSGGTRREGGHPDGWGLRRRGPAGRCADRRSAFQAVPALLLRPAMRVVPGPLWCPCPQRVRAETGVIPTIGVFAAAALWAAVPTRGRRSKPSPRFFSVGGAPGFPGRRAAPALRGSAPRRGPSRRLGSSPPRPWGPLCRPEVGVPSRPRASAQSAMRGVPGPRRRPCPQGVRAETGTIPAIGGFAAAALRAAVPTGGRRSKPSPRFFSVGDARRSGAAAPPCP